MSIACTLIVVRARDKQTLKTRTGFAPLNLCTIHEQHINTCFFAQLLKGLRYHAGAGKQFTGLFAIPPVRIPYYKNNAQVD